MNSWGGLLHRDIRSSCASPHPGRTNSCPSKSLVELMSIIIEDPALLPDLLPEDWPRPAAQSSYLSLRQLLAEPARHFFDEPCDTIEAFGG